MTIEEVINAITEATHSYRLQFAQARYNAGERVDFKYLQVSMEGIHVKRATLPWLSVNDFLINDKGTFLGIMQTGQQRPWKVVYF